MIELTTDSGTIESRLKARSQTAAEISDARLEDLERLTARYKPPLEPAPDLIEVSTNKAISDVVKTGLLRLVQRSGPRQPS